MLTLDEFKIAIKTIQEHEEDNSKLTKIMLKNSIGIVDYGFEIAALCVKLLEHIMNDKCKWISWWLYEDVNKVIEYHDQKYDVSDTESLYYLLFEKWDKLKKLSS